MFTLFNVKKYYMLVNLYLQKKNAYIYKNASLL